MYFEGSLGCMLHHERMSINYLRMCSLGQLVAIREECLETESVPMIDREIFSRIPIKHLVKKKQKTIKRRKR